MQRALFATLALAAFANAACDAPAVNSATVSLITEFEGFRANICTLFYLSTRSKSPTV